MTPLRSGILLITCCLLLGSCTNVEMQLSIVAPRGLDSREIDLDRLDEGVSVTGHDRSFAILLFPFEPLDLQSAVDDALGGRKDAVLVDVIVERTWWTALLYGRGTLTVRGILVPLPEHGEGTHR